jgi:hypothetical protein
VNLGELASYPPFGFFFAFKSLNPPRLAGFDDFFDAFMILVFLTLRVSALGSGDSDSLLKKNPPSTIL